MTDGSRSSTAYLRAATLGAVAGLRSQLPLALLALAASDQPNAALSDPPFSWLRAPIARRLAGIAAVGELLGDKLPMTPSRLDPAPLVGRLVFGGLAGSIVARGARRSLITGALLGAAGAGLGAFAGYHVRAALGRLTPLPDPLLGAAEDGIAIVLGLRATDAQGDNPGRHAVTA